MRAPLVIALVVLAIALSACDPLAQEAPPPSGGEATTGTPAAVGSPSPTPATAVGGTFRYGIGEPTAIIPPLAFTVDDRAVVDAVFDSLTAWAPTGRAIPAAAVSWTADESLTRWSFQLRPGAAFHDGSPVTAADFVHAWELAIVDGAMGYLLADVVGYDALRRGDASTLSGATAASARELEITLSRPRADFPVVVGHPSLGPLPVQTHQTDPVAYGELPIGNGPFRLTEPWVRGDFIRAARWDGWLNGTWARGGIAEVVFRIADLDINFLAFTQGRRDFTAVPPDALELAAQEYPRRGGIWNGPGLITGSRPEVYLLAINRAVPPYDDVGVRQAVSLSLDRAAIASGTGTGNLVPAASLLPPSLPGASRDACAMCTYNPSGARDRLEAADVTHLTLAFNADGGHEQIRDSLRMTLSELGVSLVSNVRGPAPSLPEYQEILAAGDVGLFRMPLSADVPSGLALLYPLLHRDRVPERGGQNYLRYDDPTVRGLLDQAARTTDVAARERLVRRVEDIVLNRHQVVVPVVGYEHAVVAADTVLHLRYSTFGLLNLTDLVLVG